MSSESFTRLNKLARDKIEKFSAVREENNKNINPLLYIALFILLLIILLNLF
jgi:hypothetical protein